MKLRTISLPDDLDQRAAAAAQREDRTYSSWARRAIERAVAGMGGDRSEQPVAIADADKRK